MSSSTPTGLLDHIRSRRSGPRSKQPGARPGSFVFEGIPRVGKVSVGVRDYSPSHYDHHEDLGLEDCLAYTNRSNPTWVHVTGLHEAEKIAGISRVLGIPDLFVEDVLSTNGRAKVEILEGAIFVQLKVFEGRELLNFQQLSIYLNHEIAVTFAEGPSVIFDPICKRLENSQGRLRNRGTGYLLWAILDSVIDHAIASADVIEQNLLEVDELIQEDHTEVSASDLYSQKHEITSMLHLVRPNREIIHALRQTSNPLIDADLAPYLDDLRDHSLSLFDECQALVDYASGMRDYLLTELNQRMTNVMKVLTCISTIFLPLTFLAGIYGMNFTYMPELNQRWAYPTIWAVFLGVGGLLIFFFRKKRWL